MGNVHYMFPELLRRISGEKGPNRSQLKALQKQQTPNFYAKNDVCVFKIRHVLSVRP